jgi:hypothetical protein
MAKKKKTPASSQLTARKTEAPMIVTRPAEVAPIAREEIARVAFAKFVARGYIHGHAVSDWLSAEAELRAAIAPA